MKNLKPFALMISAFTFLSLGITPSTFASDSSQNILKASSKLAFELYHLGRVNPVIQKAIQTEGNELITAEVLKVNKNKPYAYASFGLAIASGTSAVLTYFASVHHDLVANGITYEIKSSLNTVLSLAASSAYFTFEGILQISPAPKKEKIEFTKVKEILFSSPENQRELKQALKSTNHFLGLKKSELARLENEIVSKVILKATHAKGPVSISFEEILEIIETKFKESISPEKVRSFEELFVNLKPFEENQLEEAKIIHLQKAILSGLVRFTENLLENYSSSLSDTEAAFLHHSLRQAKEALTL